MYFIVLEDECLPCKFNICALACDLIFSPEIRNY